MRVAPFSLESLFSRVARATCEPRHPRAVCPPRSLERHATNPEQVAYSKNVKGFLIGCGVVVLLLVGVVTIGGLWAWNQFGPQITQGVQSIQKIQTELQKVVPNIGSINFNIATVNGKSTARVSAAVPFDPTVGDQPAKVAADMLRVIRQNLPAGALPATSLEIRLFRERSSGGSKTVQERTFTFDLTKPLPAPVAPKS